MTVALDTLNACMRAVGERPVTDYNSNHPTALSAKLCINDVNKEVQSRGWWFNREENMLLLPNQLGEVIVPPQTLSVDPRFPNNFLVQRDGKLYNPNAHTAVLNVGVRVDMTILLDLEDLPAIAAQYIRSKAVYDFAVEEEVDESRIQRYDRKMFEAKQLLSAEELKQADINSQHRPISLFLKSRMQHMGRMDDPNLPGGGRG